jgi:Diacylglycerol kinase catalytic domain
VSAQPPSGDPLLLVIDPAARASDGESVRVAKDVLCARASVKLTFPQTTQELRHVLAHRGRRRPVVVGDDQALHRVVQALHEQRELKTRAVAHVPVGPVETIPMARALGLPTQPAPAARAALSGAERSLDLLVDDRGGVVLGAVEIGVSGHGGMSRVGGQGPHPRGDGSAAAAWCGSVGRGALSLARTLRKPIPPLLPGRLPRLRVEADGVLLADLDRPVQLVAVSNTCLSAAQRGCDTCDEGHPDDGLVEVMVRRPSAADPLRMCARAVTVSGRDFTYAADAELTGPVRQRTWTVQPSAWRLMVPVGPG